MRQGLLFVLAIGLPCLVLVALSLRMIAQERELAEKRMADERRRIVGDVRQQLRSQLDRVRLQAINGTLRDEPATSQESGAVALVAVIERNRLVLPWTFNLTQPPQRQHSATLRSRLQCATANGTSW